MKVNYDELRKLADAATPGPWAIKPFGEKSNNWQIGTWLDAQNKQLSGWVDDTLTDYCDEPICEMENARGFADGRFIAAANPAVVLALLAERTKLLARIEKLRDRLRHITVVKTAGQTWHLREVAQDALDDDDKAAQEDSE